MYAIVDGEPNPKKRKRLIAKFPKIPEKGDLDLSLVKQSVFFCI